MKRAPPPGPVPHLTHRRRAYADAMSWGVWIGLVGMVSAYVLYVTGLLPPHVAIVRVVGHWHLPAAEFVRTCPIYPDGHWLVALREGDVLSTVLIAFLASVTIWCCAVLVPFLIRERDRTMLLITLAQVALILLAALGVFG